MIYSDDLDEFIFKKGDKRTKDRIEASTGTTVTHAMRAARANLREVYKCSRHDSTLCKVNSRKSAYSLEFLLSKVVDLVGVETLPGVKFDQANTLQDLVTRVNVVVPLMKQIISPRWSGERVDRLIQHLSCERCTSF